jgi:hypothetical protein
VRRLTPSPSMVVALIALFVSLGGVSYGVATGFIDSREIKNNTVATKDLKNNDIRSGDVRNNALTGADVNESSLGKVPSAANADSATSATSATTAGQAGVAGKVFQTFRDELLSLPTTSTFTTVLSLDVPAGTYLIIGKGWLNNNGAASARSECRTVAESDSDTQFVGMAANAENDDVTPWTNSLVHTFAAAGTIVLQCEGNPTQLTVEDRKIQALQVREISNVGATGP